MTDAKKLPFFTQAMLMACGTLLLTSGALELAALEQENLGLGISFVIRILLVIIFFLPGIILVRVGWWE